MPGSINMRHQSTLKRIGTNEIDKEGFFTFLNAAVFSLLNEAESHDIANKKGTGTQFDKTVEAINEWLEFIDSTLAKRQIG